MPTTEKEYNGYLFDQLSLLEEIELVAKEENSEKTLKLIEMKRKQIERKLYQTLPLQAMERERLPDWPNKL